MSDQQFDLHDVLGRPIAFDEIRKRVQGYGAVSKPVREFAWLAQYEQSLSATEAEIAALRAENEKALKAVAFLDRQVIAQRDAARREAEEAQVLIARVSDWTRQHGAALCPTAGSADTFGDGMREAKRQIGHILGSSCADEGAGSKGNTITCPITGQSIEAGLPPPPDGRCGIPAGTLPPCDLEWGHDGAMHANAGDGFYARTFENEHRRRQAVRAGRE